MEFSELIQKRYSVRAYDSKPVEQDKLKKILEAAQIAPTAANRQPFQMIVIHTKGREDELNRIYRGKWYSKAPVIVFMCAVQSQSWSRSDGKNYCMIDATIAMDHLILAAANLGLGTCWIAAFDPKAAREILAIPDDIEPVALTPIGYPADEWKPKHRKDLSDLIRYEKW